MQEPEQLPADHQSGHCPNFNVVTDLKAAFNRRLQQDGPHMSPIQFFAWKTYLKEIRPVVLVERKRDKLKHAELVQAIVDRVTTAWEQVSLERRHQLEVELLNLRLERGLPLGPRRPYQYDYAIASLPADLLRLTRQIADATGFHVTVLAGGPVPAAGGEISTVCVNSGQNYEHQSYTSFLGEQLSHWVEPFSCYLDTAFTEADRHSRRLTRECLDEATATELASLTFDRVFIPVVPSGDPAALALALSSVPKAGFLQEVPHLPSLSHRADFGSDAAVAPSSALGIIYYPVRVPIEGWHYDTESERELSDAGSVSEHLSESEQAEAVAQVDNQDPSSPATAVPARRTVRPPCRPSRNRQPSAQRKASGKRAGRPAGSLLQAPPPRPVRFAVDSREESLPMAKTRSGRVCKPVRTKEIVTLVEQR